MFRTKVGFYTCLALICCALPVCAQLTAGRDAAVPRLVNYSGKILDAQGKPAAGVAGVTFAIYEDQEGGAPLWLETQNVTADKNGHYSVQLGASKSTGLPLELFSSGEARWLGVQASGQAEQARTLLLSVPYALKALDAETLGGKPASAFMAAPVSGIGPSQAGPQAEQKNEIVCSSTTACQTGFVPLFSTNGGSAKVNDSLISQSGSTVKITGNESVTGNITATGGVTASFVSALNTTGAAIFGTSNGTSAGSDGVDGLTTSATASGVAGINNSNGVGVYGTSGSGTGVYGIVLGGQSSGVFGINTGGNFLVGYGVWGEADNGALDGVHGISYNAFGSGVAGVNFAGGDGVFGGVSGGGYAGYFNGDVHITGNLSKGGGSFKIDHPLDPANKYLYHSFVESPDMMNIYNGNVTTDVQGIAVVHMPEWFEALNRDFRYQLTVMGQFAQAIVAGKMVDHQFTIKTDKPNVEVSWQVTGVRHDAWADAHRIPVEQVKIGQERGRYLHPELFGAPPSKSITALRHPSATVALAKAQPLLEVQKQMREHATARPVTQLTTPGVNEKP